MNSLKKLKGSAAGKRQVLPIKVHIVKATKCSNDIMEAAIADNSGSRKLVIYNKTYHHFIKADTSIMLLNSLVKPTEVIIDAKAKIALLPKPITVDGSIMEEARHIHLTEIASAITLAQAQELPDETSCTVVVEVVELQEVQTITSSYNNRDVEVLNGIVADDTGRAELALWRKLAGTSLKVGDTISLNQVAKKPTHFRPDITLKLSSMRYTTVEAMWIMLQQEKPDDFVIATNEVHSVREFVEGAFKHIGVDIVWEGKAMEEVGKDKATGTIRVRIDPKFYRPTEVEFLQGDATKAKEKMGWVPKIKFQALVKEMMDHDIGLMKKNPSA